MSKRILSVVLCFVMVFMTVGTGRVGAEENETTQNSIVYENEQFRVENKVDSVWGQGFNATLTITNISDVPIENWAIAMELPYEISNIWNAEVKSHTENQYVIQNAGWNQLIRTDSSVSFGYTCSCTDTNIALPLEYTLLGRRTTVVDESVDVAFEVTNKWAEGYTANITINNQGGQAVCGWKLKFLSEDAITNIWNAYVEKQDGQGYVLGNADYNAMIESGGSIVIGYQAAAVSGNQISYPTGFELTHISQEETEQEEQQEAGGDRAVVEKVYAGLEPQYQGWDNEFSVTQNLFLPVSEEAQVIWTSNDKTVLADDGTVTRPSKSSRDVILTATIRRGEAELVKNFPVRVIKSDYTGYDKKKIAAIDSYESLYSRNEGIEIYLNEEDKRLEYVLGSFSDFVVESPQEAVLALCELRTLLGCREPEQEFEWVYTNEDFYSRTFCFRQVVTGVPVYGSMTNIVTDLKGNIVAVHTDYKPVAVNTTPIVALESAEVGIGAEELYAGELCIYTSGGKDRLAWQISALKNGEEQVFVVDASTGKIIFQTESEDYETQETGYGMNEWGQKAAFPMSSGTENNQPVYAMEDNTRNIKMYDASLATSISQRFDWEITSATKEISDSQAVSAYTNVIDAYDYYRDSFNRRGFGNDSAQIKVAVHEGVSIPANVDSKVNNAMHKNGNLVFGEATEAKFIHSYAAAKDVVIHEYTHGVVKRATSLSGGANTAKAINEAYADIMGALATGEWQHAGSVLNTKCNRDIARPENSVKPCPTAIEDKYYSTANNPHDNSTIISHACYYMYSHGISDKTKLAQLWYSSLGMGYGSDAAYQDVRINVMAAAKLLPFRFSEGDLKVIGDAFDNANIMAVTGVTITGSSKLSGKVVEADSDRNAGNNAALHDVQVTVKKLDGTEVKTGKTDHSGDYSLSGILPGKYQLVFTKSGYEEETLYFTIAMTKPVNYFPIVELIPNSLMTKTGTAQGQIKEAGMYALAKGVTLYVREGVSNQNGEAIDSTVTDDKGKYSFTNLRSGNYCVEIADEREVEDKSRYLTTYFNIKVIGGEVIDNQNAAVTRKLNMNQVKIVLQWGEKPLILDSYLLGRVPNPNSGGYEQFLIGPRTKKYTFQNTLVARLDNTSGHGLETITIDTSLKGKYAFYVHNYSREESFYLSGAYVQIYIGGENTAEYSVYVKNIGIAEYWDVFSYDAETGKINIINTYAAWPISKIVL